MITQVINSFPEVSLGVVTFVRFWEWVNDHAGAMQALLAIVLAAITAIYTRETRTIARGTRLMAQATQAMLDVSDQQRRDAVMPHVIFNSVSASDFAEIEVGIVNAGPGPALNLGVVLRHPIEDFHLEMPSGPIALAQGTSIVVTIRLDMEHAFRLEEQLAHGPSDGVTALCEVAATYNGILSTLHESRVRLEWTRSTLNLQLAAMYITQRAS